MKLLHFAHPSGEIDSGMETIVLVEDDCPESEYGDHARPGWVLKTVMLCDAARGYSESALPTERDMVSS